MRSDLVGAGSTTVGRIRQLNEDGCHVGAAVFAVADGLGGHAAGDVASTLTIEAVASLDHAGTGAAGVERALLEANRRVLEYAESHPEAAGLGSTVCGAVREDDHWIVFNVGDSRCYILSDGAIRQVTTDHSEVQELVDQGQLTKEQARVHPRRNVITRAIGQRPPPVIDVFVVPADPGLRLMMCTDGLPSEVSDADIARICALETEPGALAAALVAAADEAGGRDNTTVVVVSDPRGVPVLQSRKPVATVPRDLILRELAE